MSDTAIRVENLGKLYQIGQGYHHTLRETLTSAMSAPFRAFTSSLNGRNGFESEPEAAIREQPSHAIWALRDISFEIKKGETVGIIGPNGSGKSTLLKLLARITEPTEGEIYINGRVTALIELGAGFHPELTGRENIFLNGAILGMTKGEIKTRFAEIVEFAGIGDFLDMPVKHYSSGMSVRLGFALAVSVDPEILLVDEVLAVGDAGFRKRCFEKIYAFIEAKKTIIIVTHNFYDLQRVARRALLVYRGAIQADDSLDNVVGSYASLIRNTGEMPPRSASVVVGMPGIEPPIEVVRVQLCDAGGNDRSIFKTRDELRVRIDYVAYKRILNPVFRIQIYRSDGLFCHGMNTERHGIALGEIHGEGAVVLRYPHLGLLEGDYLFHIAVLAQESDEIPLHQSNPQIIHVESQRIDGGGILTMACQWEFATKLEGQTRS